MTTLIDIYEAAGGQVNEDRTQVSMTPNARNLFKIELTVGLMAIDMMNDGQPKVTLGVVLHPEVLIREGGLGATIEEIHHDAELTLPVDQIKLIKEE